jgi:hypothetical protein
LLNTVRESYPTVHGLMNSPGRVGQVAKAKQRRLTDTSVAPDDEHRRLPAPTGVEQHFDRRHSPRTARTCNNELQKPD